MKQPTTRTEWLEARRKGLGATDVVAVMGLSQFRSPWAVWLSKVKPDESLDSLGPNLDEMAEAGKRHEPTIAKWFEDATESKLYDPGEFALSWSEDMPYLFCTPDRFIGELNKLAVVELKCAWYEAAKEWKERVPIAYQCQIQAQMYCTGLDKGYFAVLLNGYRFKYFEIARNQRFIDAMLRKCEAFWKLVESQTPPPADFSQATSDALKVYYSEPKPADVELGAEWWEIHEQRERGIALEKEGKKIKDEASNKLRAAIGNCERAVLHDGSIGYTWKPTARGRALRKVKINDNLEV